MSADLSRKITVTRRTVSVRNNKERFALVSGDSEEKISTLTTLFMCLCRFVRYKECSEVVFVDVSKFS